MPIRPENITRYPADWPAISWTIRWIRALGRCECRGECGRPALHLDRTGPFGRCRNVNGGRAFGTGTTVVLTVAHLDHTPENCDPANLRAMCAGCHLAYDGPHHAQTRSTTRTRARAAAGELPLPFAEVMAR
jgi:hypothetical protein